MSASPRVPLVERLLARAAQRLSSAGLHPLRLRDEVVAAYDAAVLSGDAPNDIDVALNQRDFQHVAYSPTVIVGLFPGESSQGTFFLCRCVIGQGVQGNVDLIQLDEQAVAKAFQLLIVVICSGPSQQFVGPCMYSVNCLLGFDRSFEMGKAHGPDVVQRSLLFPTADPRHPG